MVISDMRSIVFSGQDIILPSVISDETPASVGFIFENFSRSSIAETVHVAAEKHWPVLVRESNANTFEGSLYISKAYGFYELKAVDVHANPPRSVAITINEQTFRRFIKRLED